MATVARRVSYILPAPSEPPPLLNLPSLGERRRGHTSPHFVPKEASGSSFQSRNPFASPGPKPSQLPVHPRHCLGISSLAIDASTLLANVSSPGGILYTGGRDGLVASWELDIPHKRRRGARYGPQPGRLGRTRWERIGDGAYMWADDEEEDRSFDDEEDNSSSEDEMIDEGWVGVDGDRFADGMRRRKAGRGELPYEDRWEIDQDELAKRKPPPSAFRQSAQIHTDWVNAMLLCNLNQTVITGSSDRTIRAWSPHAASDDAGLSPSLVGRHRDYVRSLAWAKYPSLLFSGALDRTLSIWDINGSSPDAPLLNIDLNKADDYGGVGLEGERGSVYALGVDPAGKLLGAGTPERVVRLWDPRVGDKSIGKLIGHSDCVRSVLVSEDGRYMLTGSSDTTIKLWSLAAHRCLHTFNHHTSSVWALHSAHPNLERFYSGSRDGHLCVVDVEQCSDLSDGECVVLAREGDVPLSVESESKSGDEGIRCIVAMDDEFVWSATSSADLKRWKDVGRRVLRLSNHDDGVSYNDRANGNIYIDVPHERKDPFVLTPITGSRSSIDRDTRSVAFARPPAKRNGLSQDVFGSPFSQSSAFFRDDSSRDRVGQLQQPRTTPSGAPVAGSFRSESSMNGDDGQNPAHSLTLNGLPYASLVRLGLPESPYSFGLSPASRDSQPRESISSVPQGLSNLLKPDMAGSPHRGSALLERDQTLQQMARLEFEDREVAAEAKPLRDQPDEVIRGRSGLVRSLILNDRQHVLTVGTDGEVAAWNIIRGECVGHFSPAEVTAALELERGVKAGAEVRKHSQEVLELVKERIEGETMVITWCQVDTKIGSLVVHLEEGRVFDAEVYADELGLEGLEGIKEDARINLGKWALANLFQGLIRAEEREITSTNAPANTTAQPSINRGSAPMHITVERAHLSPSHRKRSLTSPSMSTSQSLHSIPGIASPALTPAILPEPDSGLSRSVPSGTSGFQSFGALRTSQLPAIPQSPPSQATTPGDVLAGRGDYFSIRRSDTSPSRSEVKAPATPGGTAHTLQSPLQTPGGSFMGKLKGLGKKKTAETPMSTVVESQEAAPVDEGPKLSEREASQLQILDIVRAHPFNPPPPWEAPPLKFPPSTSLLIAEESKDAGAWVVTYRSQVSSTERDMEKLEANSPLWLLDYLFTSRTKTKDPVKLTFILEPAPDCGLSDMPEGTTRLSASRVLRARKICAFIFDKLELGPQRGGRSGSTVSTNSRITYSVPRRASNATPALTHAQAGGAGLNDADVVPEEVIELLCGDAVVDPKITLATLKQYYGAAGDMLLHYRPKQGVAITMAH